MAAYPTEKECPRCGHFLMWVLSMEESLGGEILELKCLACARIWKYLYAVRLKGKIIRLREIHLEAINGSGDRLVRPERRPRTPDKERPKIRVSGTKSPLERAD